MKELKKLQSFMETKNNIFVSGASGIVGYGILKSLSEQGHSLFGSTIYEESAAQKFSDFFVKAIPTNHPDYLTWIIDTFKQNKIDLAFPGIEADVQFWSKNKAEIEKQSGAKLVLNKPELIELCTDKWTFYSTLSPKLSSVLITTYLEQDFGFLVQKLGLPFLLKPRIGYASQGIVTINNEKEFSLVKENLGTKLMAQEIVGNSDEEYTIAAFGDGNGSFYNLFSMQRTLSKEGFTQTARVIANDDFQEVVASICKILKPIGPTNFQFRKKENQLKLLEINPRISSSTSIRSSFNYNESAMCVDFFLNNISPKSIEYKRGTAIRYSEDIIYYE